MFDRILADYEAFGLVGESANKLLSFLPAPPRQLIDLIGIHLVPLLARDDGQEFLWPAHETMHAVAAVTECYVMARLNVAYFAADAPGF